LTKIRSPLSIAGAIEALGTLKDSTKLPRTRNPRIS